MNTVHARRWLKAAAACDFQGSYAGPLALLEACAPLDCAWQGAVSGAGGSVRLLPRPLVATSASVRAAAALVLGLKNVPPPAANGDWIDAAWDTRKGSWTAVRTGAPKGKVGPFRAKDFAEPVNEALARFHRLNPLASVRRTGEAWSLILERPLPWPLFLRCDLSAAFQPRSSQLSLLLRDAGVTALDFDGEALWARFSG